MKRRSAHILLLVCFATGVMLWSREIDGLSAQEATPAREPTSSEMLLVDQDPFDLLTVLDQEGKPMSLKMFPVELPNRQIPDKPNPNAKLRIRLMDYPDYSAEIAWKDIVELELYEQMVLAETQQLVREGQFERAFDSLAFLIETYPKLPGLEVTRQNFLYLDAGRQFTDKQYHLAFALLEELYQRNPTFRLNDQLPTLVESIGKAVDMVAQDYLAKGDYRSLRAFVSRVAASYKDSSQMDVSKWEAGLLELAKAKGAEARSHLEAGRWREAHASVREMKRIAPKIEGATELALEIDRRAPMVFVAVSQPAPANGSERIDNWASRRVGRLTRQTLLRLAGRGSEGGQYLCPFGSPPTLSEDRKQLTFRLNPIGFDGKGLQVDGYDFAWRLLESADPYSPNYIPAWGRLVDKVRLENMHTVIVDLQHVHVLPDALLEIPLQSQANPAHPEDGPYVTSARSPSEVEFVPNPRDARAGSSLQPAIVEQYFVDSQIAVRALLDGDIDVIDRVFPADLPRLKRERSIAVEPYDLCTVHFLVPNTDNPFLNNLMFRQAIYYGINRPLILNTLLLDGQDLPGCRVLSAPFPAPSSETNDVAYAYDDRIEPRPYERLQAATYVILAERQIEAAAQRANQEPPKRSDLVLAYPAGEVPRIACQSIAQQLLAAGIKIQLRELPPDVTADPQRQYDLLYVEATVWEPLVDARRLLGPDGVAHCVSPYISLALRHLDAAQEWTQARQRLWELHRTVFDDVTVIPLWQMVNFFARSKRLEGIGERPLTLYQNIDSWQLAP